MLLFCNSLWVIFTDYLLIEVGMYKCYSGCSVFSLGDQMSPMLNITDHWSVNFVNKLGHCSESKNMLPNSQLIGIMLWSGIRNCA